MVILILNLLGIVLLTLVVLFIGALLWAWFWPEF